MQRQKAKTDEWYTPRYAVMPILPYIRRGSTIWCPFDKEHSEYVKVFQEHGLNVIYGHIETGQDFFKEECPECDYIISNPPYSIKDDILERLLQLDKPFAMLMNASGIFDSKRRVEMFTKKPIEILYLYPRVNFFNDELVGSSSATYQSSYICRNMLNQQIETCIINRK